LPGEFFRGKEKFGILLRKGYGGQEQKAEMAEANPEMLKN
jgi:hypothetical protein